MIFRPTQLPRGKGEMGAMSILPFSHISRGRSPPRASSAICVSRQLLHLGLFTGRQAARAQIFRLTLSQIHRLYNKWNLAGHMVARLVEMHVHGNRRFIAAPDSL